MARWIERAGPVVLKTVATYAALAASTDFENSAGCVRCGG